MPSAPTTSCASIWSASNRTASNGTRENPPHRASMIESTREPPFSVIVPTYRRDAALARCLEALAHQTLSSDRFEVVVADDGSGAPPRDLVARFGARLSITLIEAAHGGPGAARNAAAARARGRFLALTDDDCAPDPAWLATLERTLEREPDALVGGRVE